MRITQLTAHKILNSAGDWTIEVRLELDNMFVASASVPGGYSRGSNEADTLQPHDAIEKLEELKDDLMSKNFKNQKELDSFLIEKDGTEKKSNLGGNVMLGISVAFCKASARMHNLQTYEHIHTLVSPEIPLNDISFRIPELLLLVFEGGLHGSGKATIQEFMAIVPDIERGAEIYKAARKLLHNKHISTNVGAEGAFSPDLTNEQVLTELKSLLKNEEGIALDVAASSFKELNAQIPDYENLIADFPILSIEDPYPENDWTAWENFYRTYRGEINVIADDLTTTNPDILQEAIRRDCANGIIIKPNQIGTLTEVFEAINLARQHEWKIIVSHRGTDTNDDFIADLAIGANADYVKFGGMARGERIAKYNRLLEIKGPR